MRAIPRMSGGAVNIAAHSGFNVEAMAALILRVSEGRAVRLCTCNGTDEAGPLVKEIARQFARGNSGKLPSSLIVAESRVLGIYPIPLPLINPTNKWYKALVK